jgi:hypothetical protein
MKKFKLPLFFSVSFIFILTACQKSNDFEVPSKYIYTHTKTSGQKTYVIDVNKKATEISNNVGSFRVSNKLALDSVFAISNNIQFNLGKFNYFEFITESKTSTNFTDVTTGITIDLPATYTRNGTVLIIDGDETPILRLSDDFEELYLCNEVQRYVYKLADGTMGSSTDLDVCSSLSLSESVKNFLLSYPTSKPDTISITYYDQVFKKQ